MTGSNSIIAMTRLTEWQQITGSNYATVIQLEALSATAIQAHIGFQNERHAIEIIEKTYVDLCSSYSRLIPFKSCLSCDYRVHN